MVDSNLQPKKSLGQHWLNDSKSLESIVDEAGLTHDDHVLEIGPGMGVLTDLMVTKAASVTAVEIDGELVRLLERKSAGMSHDRRESLTIVHQNILDFDLSKLPINYKVVANIPYYLTGKIIRFLLEADNPPSRIVLLVQKEVAERLAAKPGQVSLLAISAQFYCQTRLGVVVPAEAFTPPPKVDSRVVILDKLASSAVEVDDKTRFFRLIKAGFAEKRKKLRSSLSGGLHMTKNEIDNLLAGADIPADARAQELSLEDWARLDSQLTKSSQKYI